DVAAGNIDGLAGGLAVALINRDRGQQVCSGSYIFQLEISLRIVYAGGAVARKREGGRAVFLAREKDGGALARLSRDGVGHAAANRIGARRKQGEVHAGNLFPAADVDGGSAGGVSCSGKIGGGVTGGVFGGSHYAAATERSGPPTRRGTDVIASGREAEQAIFAEIVGGDVTLSDQLFLALNVGGAQSLNHNPGNALAALIKDAAGDDAGGNHAEENVVKLLTGIESQDGAGTIRRLLTILLGDVTAAENDETI